MHITATIASKTDFLPESEMPDAWYVVISSTRTAG